MSKIWTKFSTCSSQLNNYKPAKIASSVRTYLVLRAAVAVVPRVDVLAYCIFSNNFQNFEGSNEALPIVRTRLNSHW